MKTETLQIAKQIETELRETLRFKKIVDFPGGAFRIEFVKNGEIFIVGDDMKEDVLKTISILLNNKIQLLDKNFEAL